MKNKIEEIIKKDTLAIICPKCGGGGWSYEEKKDCSECEGDGLTEWRFGDSAKDILQTVYKEIKKKRPKDKKILYPQNGCEKDCKLCWVERDNWNGALKKYDNVIKKILEVEG